MYKIDKFDFKNKKVIIRVDFNIPLGDLSTLDNLRIKASIPTIKKVIDNGGIAILISHLGRPIGFDKSLSLKHLVPYLKQVLNQDIFFSEESIGSNTKQLINRLVPGQILLLENIRFYKEEINCEKEFSKKLSDLGDVYINDAFGTSHRNHSSILGIPQYINHKMKGYLMEQEVKNAELLINHNQKPFSIIVGGAKINDKINLLYGLLNKQNSVYNTPLLDNILIGGRMANTFLKAKGYAIGNSVYEKDNIEKAKEIMEIAIQKKSNLLLPFDVYAAKNINTQTRFYFDIDELDDDMMIFDIGPKTQKLYHDMIIKSKTILWNGPMGLYENKNFIEGTNSIASSIALATKKGSFSLVGGGDSATAIYQLSLENHFSYISTGGGALMSYILNEKLQAINILDI